MALSVKGKIEQILKPESGTSKAGKEWSKQEFVIETDDQYPKKVCFTLFGDKVNLVDGLAAGQEVEVSFNVESREYNGRWYTDVRAWKVERPGAANSGGGAPQQGSEGEGPFANTGQMEDPFASGASASDGADDLPF